jgi:citrate lyase subunit gamma (acyl carrier protein)
MGGISLTKLLKTGQAGTIESSDIMITLAPAATGNGIQIELTSPVNKQFGRQIRAMIDSVLREHEITDAEVHAIDKGALDCTIRARTTSAIRRAAMEEI